MTLARLIVIAAVALTGCKEAPFRVLRARELGPLEQSPSIQGRDGGYSARLWGRSVWAYGDTVLALKGERGGSWRHNSWSHTADLDASDGLTGFSEPTDGKGAPRELFPQTAAERAFNDAHSEVLQGSKCASPCGARWALWPGPLVWDSERSRALVVYTKIYGEPGEWNFHGVGMGVATWGGLDRPLVRHVVSPGAAHPTLLFQQHEPQFSSAAVVRAGELYLLGCGGPGKQCRLARVSLGQVLEREAWRFFSGGARWSDDPRQAAGLFEGMDMTSVHHNPKLGLWLAVYSPPFANEVRMRSAPELSGPWSPPLVVVKTLAPPGKDKFAYSGLGHAELARDNGRLEYVSYYRETRPWWGELRLVELELAKR